MNKNTLIIGGAILVIGGAIATGALLNDAEKSSKGKQADENMAQELEEQSFKDFEDEDRYSFCQGREEIKGVYTNSIFGNEKGNVEYTSDDISVFDKENNKLYILGRRIEYKYSGNAKMEIAGGQGTMDIEERGVTTEYFSRYGAPVRIDYNAKIINPAPERKSSDWVVINIKSIGTLMGFTDEREEIETGDAKVFCSSFNLDGAFDSSEYFSFKKACPDHSPNPGVNFSGNFKFECGGVENKRGIEIAKEYKESEQLENEFKAITDDDNEEIENEFKNLIKEEQPVGQDIQKKLQGMGDEIKANYPAE